MYTESDSHRKTPGPSFRVSNLNREPLSKRKRGSRGRMKTHVEKMLWGTCPRHGAKLCVTRHSGIFRAMPKGTGALDNSMDR